MSYTVASIKINANKVNENIDPVYRIFLDDQLIIERKFWADASKNSVLEVLTFDDDDKEHKIKIKNVFPDRGTFEFNKIEFSDGDNNENIDVEYTFVDNVYTFKTEKK